MAPRQIPKQLGINASESAAHNYIRPTSHWKEIYNNNYQMNCLNFWIDGLEQDVSGKNVLKIFHSAYPENFFTTFVYSIQLKKPGRPNQ